MKNRLLTITFFLGALFLGLCVMLAPSPAVAQYNPWARDEYVFAQILSGQTAVSPEEKLNFALDLKFKAGWYGYAPNYNAAEPAPRFDWSRSKNISNVEVFWQAPKRLQTTQGYRFIYDGEMLLPLTVTVEQVGKPIELRGSIDLVVCEKECVPQHLDVILALSEGEAKVNMDEPRIDNAFAALPTKGDYVSLKFENAKVEKNRLVFRIYSLSGFSEKDDLFIRCDALDCPKLLDPPTIGLNESKPHEALFLIPAPKNVTNLKKALKGYTLTVTFIHAAHVIEKKFEF